MSETCGICKKQYNTVYRVPNEVWSKIAPNKKELGNYPEHQFGGLLCVDCAFVEAQKIGVTLYFSASVGDWAENKTMDFVETIKWFLPALEHAVLKRQRQLALANEPRNVTVSWTTDLDVAAKLLAQIKSAQKEG